jgi:hypothetical protein
VKITVERIEAPKDCNTVLGQTHFIKSVEDLYEALKESSPSLEFGLAFNESSGECLVRCEGTHEDLKKAAAENALRVGAGHFFVIFLRRGFPVSVLNRIKNVSEVCSVYCASANPIQVVLAEAEQGRGVLGVIDGSRPKGVEDEAGVKWRKDLLRKIGYKL